MSAAKENHLNHDEIKILRQQQAQPVLEQLHRWLSEQHAVSCPKRHWPGHHHVDPLAKTDKIPDDGRYQMDNNLIENTIRPVALGRKNYLFAGSHGSKARSQIYSC
ncbi:MAG: transposase [Bacteroidetes bacterium]|nr:transposase [Bacteroidota bacterium]